MLHLQLRLIWWAHFTPFLENSSRCHVLVVLSPLEWANHTPLGFLRITRRFRTFERTTTVAIYIIRKMECLTTPLNVSPRVKPEGEDHKTFWFGNQTRGPLRPPRINTLGVHGYFKRCEPAAPDRLVLKNKTVYENGYFKIRSSGHRGGSGCIHAVYGRIRAYIGCIWIVEQFSYILHKKILKSVV